MPLPRGIKLAEISTSLPHAAYAAFVHGLSSKWTHLARTVPGIKDLSKPLEKALNQVLIPSLTGKPPCSELTRNLLALPVRVGGLGLVNPSTTLDTKFMASMKLTTPLSDTIVSQDQTKDVDPTDIINQRKERD